MELYYNLFPSPCIKHIVVMIHSLLCYILRFKQVKVMANRHLFAIAYNFHLATINTYMIIDNRCKSIKF